MAEPKGQVVRLQAWVTLLLALVGGYVDAVGYLVLFKMFTAHMSGNSIATTVYVGEGDWSEAFHRAFPIPVFVAGVAVGAALLEALHRGGVRRALAAAFGLETLLLVAFMALGAAVYHGGALRPAGAAVFYLLAALPALAMGLQNSALRRVGGLGVRTTYITGMLTNFAEEAVQCAYSSPGHDFGRTALYLGIWLGYVVGGVVGALSNLHWGLLCLYAPVAVLSGVAALDLIRPIAPPHPPPTKAEWEP